jgi:hypothetical protein
VSGGWPNDCAFCNTFLNSSIEPSLLHTTGVAAVQVRVLQLRRR